MVVFVFLVKIFLPSCNHFKALLVYVNRSRLVIDTETGLNQ
jgi:hypothetical protein